MTGIALIGLVVLLAILCLTAVFAPGPDMRERAKDLVLEIVRWRRPPR